jgi:hypothetical protein
MGFCTKERHRRFLELCPLFEKNMVIDNGIILLKYWLEVGDAEQERRFRARDQMPEATDTNCGLRPLAHRALRRQEAGPPEPHGRPGGLPAPPCGRQ